MREYDRMRYLVKLKQIHEARTGIVNKDSLSEEFLRFSQILPPGKLLVHQPKMYKVRGEEIKHLNDALDFHQQMHLDIDEIDMTGGTNYESIDNIIILSMAQINADHITRSRSYLNPLIENVFKNGHQLISNFSINHALTGIVKSYSDGIELNEAHLFPNRFEKGKYRLETCLDTPSNTIADYKRLTDTLEGFVAQPKRSMLDKRLVEDTTRLALNLRKELGALSRYQSSDPNFSSSTNSVIRIKSDNTEFFLYSEKHDENVLVYFGENRFKKEPYDLEIIDGSKSDKALTRLLELDFLKVSRDVMQRRLEDLKMIYDETIRKEQTSSESGSELSTIIRKLEEVYQASGNHHNDESKKNFLLKQPTELYEFAICPATEDPVIHEILPRVSWNKYLREYQNTIRFISGFERASEEYRSNLLSNVTSSILFNNQQNNDVNFWLYKNHEVFCRDQGIGFEII